MNKRDESKLSDQYRQMPRVDSPAHLDKRILDAAHRHVPEQRAGSVNRWIPTLATVCVAGVVFYTAMPLFQVSSYQPPVADSIQSDAVIQEEVAEAEVADTASGLTIAPAPVVHDAKRKQVAVEQKTLNTRKADQEIKAVETPKPHIALKKEAFKNSERIESAASASAPAKLQLKELNASAASADLKKNQQLGISARQRSVSLSPREIAQRIERITALAEEALIADAQRLLDELIAQCVECEIPTSLAALKESMREAESNKPVSNDLD